jgi:hypothetical protein
LLNSRQEGRDIVLALFFFGFAIERLALINEGLD